jgi:hypothetical protein
MTREWERIVSDSGNSCEWFNWGSRLSNGHEYHFTMVVYGEDTVIVEG